MLSILLVLVETFFESVYSRSTFHRYKIARDNTVLTVYSIWYLAVKMISWSTVSVSMSYSDCRCGLKTIPRKWLLFCVTAYSTWDGHVCFCFHSDLELMSCPKVPKKLRTHTTVQHTWCPLKHKGKKRERQPCSQVVIMILSGTQTQTVKDTREQAKKERINSVRALDQLLLL